MRSCRLTGTAVLLLLSQAGCSNDKIAAGGSAGCPAEAAQFAASIGQADGVLAAAAPANQAPETKEAIVRLTAAIDQVTTVYGTLKTCRLAKAASLRAAALASREMSAERSAYLGDLNAARQFQGRVTLVETSLQNQAQRIEAALPGGKIKAVRALAAPPEALIPYVTLETASIHALPREASPVVAEIRHGRRVQGPAGPQPQGWVTLTLNDGSVGYVESSLIEDAPSNPSALITNKNAESVRDLNDPLVALAIAAERTLPASVDLLASSTEAANEAGATGFGS